MIRNLAVTLISMAMLVACSGNKIYDHYEHTPLKGWDRVDHLSFDVPPVPYSTRYVTTLGLRINESYPFQALTLIVDQTVYPSKKTRSDTISCTLFDKKGAIKGNGISYFQYHYRVSELDLEKGDSLHVTVRHDMRREIMPGISDVGIIVRSQQ